MLGFLRQSGARRSCTEYLTGNGIGIGLGNGLGIVIVCSHPAALASAGVSITATIVHATVAVLADRQSRSGK